MYFATVCTFNLVCGTRSYTVRIRYISNLQVSWKLVSGIKYVGRFRIVSREVLKVWARRYIYLTGFNFWQQMPQKSTNRVTINYGYTNPSGGYSP